MKLTNEQRAHDLAVANLPVARRTIRSITSKKMESNQRYEFYFEYVKLYNIFLEAINRDFPSA